MKGMINMSMKLKLTMLIFSISLILAIVMFLRKGKMPVKYSLPWLFVAGIFMLLAVFPKPVNYLQRVLGFESLSNMLLFILVGLLLLVTLFLTMVVSEQRKKINLLVQDVSIIKKGK